MPLAETLRNGDVSQATELIDELQAISNLRVEHPSWLEARGEILDLHLLRTVRQNGSGILITGESGAGKTALLRSIEATFPRRTEPERTVVPCLMTAVPARPTIKSIAQSILLSLGEPMALAKGPQVKQLTERIITLVAGCRTELVLIDEVAHLVDGRRNDSLSSVADWLKELADAIDAPLVLAGLPRAEDILESNVALRRRFATSVTLEVVRVDDAVPDLKTFRAVVRKIEQCLPIPSAVRLHEPKMAFRILFATDGRMGYLMALLERAVRICRRSGRPVIDVDVLAEAFRRAIWKGAVGTRNPFDEDFAWKRLNGRGEPFASTLGHSSRKAR